MKGGFPNLFRDFVALIYPRNCAGCGQALSKGEEILCTICKYEIPRTNYHKNNQNQFFLKFAGRIRIEFAIAFLHFHKKGITQQLLHNFKYRNQPEIGEKIGEWFGSDLVEAGFGNEWDMVLPVPLHQSKEKRRGYNQSNYFAKGLGSVLGIPAPFNKLQRTKASETQTNKSRGERWMNVEGIFKVLDSRNLKDKHVLLVDDVVTTGSTLESCGQAILDGGAGKLSLATLAIAH